MRKFVRVAGAAALVAAAAAGGSLVLDRPASAQDRVVGPVVGDETDQFEKRRPKGSLIYRNATTRRLVATVMFEALSDAARLALEEPSEKFTDLAELSGKLGERCRAISVEVGPGASLWLKCDGGVARWQVVGAVRAD